MIGKVHGPIAAMDTNTQSILIFTLAVYISDVQCLPGVWQTAVSDVQCLPGVTDNTKQTLHKCCRRNTTCCGLEKCLGSTSKKYEKISNLQKIGGAHP